MPLKVETVGFLDEGKDEEVDFVVSINSDGGIFFHSPPGHEFDIDSELALAELGFELPPQILFYHVFKKRGIIGLLADERFRGDIGYGLSKGGYKDYGTIDSPYSEKDLAQDLGTAFKSVFNDENLGGIEDISNIVRDCLSKEVEWAKLYTYPTETDSGHTWESGVWHNMQMYLGGVEIAGWNRYGEKEIGDPIHFTTGDMSDTTDIQDMYLIESAMDALQLTEEALEFPDPDHPESDPDGRWGVVYIDKTGEYLGLDNQDNPQWAPSFDLVTYKTLHEAEEAVELSSEIIGMQDDLDDWVILIVKYDGAFGSQNLIEKLFPEMTTSCPRLGSDADVLMPWELHSVES